VSANCLAVWLKEGWCDTSHGSKTLLQALLGPPRDGAFGVVTAQLCYAQLGCSRPGTGQ